MIGMRSLRARLFAAILGAVLLAVGVSLALGIVLTRDATRDSIAENLRRDADLLAARFSTEGSVPDALFEAPAPPPGAPGPPGEAGPAPFAIPIPHEGPGGSGLPPIMPLEDAEAALPAAAGEALRAGEAASGTVEIEGEEQLFEARPVGDAAVVVARPDVVAGGFGDYLSALLIASGLAALVAAGVAALVSRRLAAPLARVADASRVLASGGDPEPLPRERTAELAALADAFNAMAAQLGRAREAERSVLLSVSHDLRTPLTAIEGYAEGIEDGTLEPGAAAAVVGREAKRLERLVDDLLALAKLRQGVLEVRWEPVELGVVLREAEERLRPQADDADVRLEVATRGAGTVSADGGRVLQVATNLVENAIRHTPEGGRVTVSGAEDGFEVADEGPGIPAEELPRAFERFHLRDRLGGGSPSGAGLGLAIVRELTEAMGGEVSVESPAGEGARFRVRLSPAGDIERALDAA